VENQRHDESDEHENDGHDGRRQRFLDHSFHTPCLFLPIGTPALPLYGEILRASPVLSGIPGRSIGQLPTGASVPLEDYSELGALLDRSGDGLR
jgi:hypothetical protein